MYGLRYKTNTKKKKKENNFAEESSLKYYVSRISLTSLSRQYPFSRQYLIFVYVNNCIEIFDKTMFQLCLNRDNILSLRKPSFCEISINIIKNYKYYRYR